MKIKAAILALAIAGIAPTAFAEDWRPNIDASGLNLGSNVADVNALLCAAMPATCNASITNGSDPAGGNSQTNNSTSPSLVAGALLEIPEVDVVGGGSYSVILKFVGSVSGVPQFQLVSANSIAPFSGRPGSYNPATGVAVIPGVVLKDGNGVSHHYTLTLQYVTGSAPALLTLTDAQVTP